VAFALMTVVRATRPTSGKPGDKAIWTERGEWLGWVGGSCAEPVARRAAVRSLADGECRLLHVTNDETDFVRAGVEVARMTCHSGGSLEIYVEPHLPRPSLVVFGRSPIAQALCKLGVLMKYRVVAVDLEPDPGVLEAAAVPGAVVPEPIERAFDFGALEGLPVARRFVVVASHGRFEIEALEWAFRGGASYVGLVTSRRRLPDVLARLGERGFGPEQLGALRAPAGLSIGAAGPEEVALSVLSELVAERRREGERSAVEIAEGPGHEPARAAPHEPPAGTVAARQSAPRVAEQESLRSDTQQPARARRRSCCDGEATETADAALLRSESAPSPPLRFSAVVLAAGLSRRMGARNKLLLPMAGEPMIRRVVESVLGAGFVEVVVVTGHQADEVRRALAPLVPAGVRLVHNERFDSGQVSSVRAGLAALEQTVDAVAVCLGDQPLVGSADLLALSAAYRERPHGSILVPMRGEERGNPVIVDWSSVRDTLERGLDFGCRHYIDQHPERVYRWSAPSDHFFRDVDEPADYQALLPQETLEAKSPERVPPVGPRA
jgi:xanthine dehydrogenase accessory factor